MLDNLLDLYSRAIDNGIEPCLFRYNVALDQLAKLDLTEDEKDFYRLLPEELGADALCNDEFRKLLMDNKNYVNSKSSFFFKQFRDKMPLSQKQQQCITTSAEEIRKFSLHTYVPYSEIWDALGILLAELSIEEDVENITGILCKNYTGILRHYRTVNCEQLTKEDIKDYRSLLSSYELPHLVQLIEGREACLTMFKQLEEGNRIDVIYPVLSMYLSNELPPPEWLFSESLDELDKVVKSLVDKTGAYLPDYLVNHKDQEFEVHEAVMAFLEDNNSEEILYACIQSNFVTELIRRGEEVPEVVWDIMSDCSCENVDKFLYRNLLKGNNNVIEVATKSDRIQEKYTHWFFREELSEMFTDLNRITEESLNFILDVQNSETLYYKFNNITISDFIEINTMPAGYVRLYNKLVDETEHAFSYVKCLFDMGFLTNLETKDQLQKLTDLLLTMSPEELKEIHDRADIGANHYLKIKLLRRENWLDQITDNNHVPFLCDETVALTKNRSLEDSIVLYLKNGADTLDIMRLMGPRFTEITVDSLYKLYQNNKLHNFAAFYRDMIYEVPAKQMYRILLNYLSGKYYTEKYKEGELSREIAFDINAEIEKNWVQNIELSDGEFTIKEEDSFSSMLEFGSKTGQTQFSCNGGKLRDVLPSFYNANKKIISVYCHGVKLAEGLFTLTKYSKDDIHHKDDALDSTMNTELIKGVDLCIVAALINYNQDLNRYAKKNISDSFLKIAVAKAKSMGIVVFNSNDRSKGYNVFIPLTKAGRQLLNNTCLLKAAKEGCYDTMYLKRIDYQ